MTNQGPTLIEAKDIRKSFTVGTGPVEVLKGINVTIKGGEFVIIFGPSGCGKSTLLHTLLGLEVPSSGTLFVEGNDFYAKNEDERALYRRHKVGMIYQQALWISSFNVIENVSLPLQLLNYEAQQIHDKAIESLNKVGLAQWAEYSPTELSSGQQQKISLARALMIDPAFIVADEPTGNLDTVSGKELLSTFMDLVTSGKTIIMVTHDLEYLKYATKIFHMVDGQVVEEYSPKDIGKLKIEGKKEIAGDNAGDSNVRDPEFLKKVKI